jgi:hypothetical protein
MGKERLKVKISYPALSLALTCLLLLANVSHATLKLPDDITKIALVIGAPKEAVESSWGHSFLRFSSKAKFDLSDTTIEFTAFVPNKLNVVRGLGIFPYKMDVTISNYASTSTNYSQVMDRDLVQYELDLTPLEIKRFVDLMNLRLDHNREDSYNFLFNNCTSVISEIIEEVTQKKISSFSKNVPVWIPEKLKKLGLIKNEFTILSNTSIRKKIIEMKFSGVFDKYLKDLANVEDYYLIYNLKEQLKSLNFGDRLVGYLKIVYLFKKQKIDKEALGFAKYLVSSEMPSVKLNLLNLLNFKLESSYAFSPLHYQAMKEISREDERLLKSETLKKELDVVFKGRGKPRQVELSFTTLDFVQVPASQGQQSDQGRTFTFVHPDIVVNYISMDLTIDNKLVDLIDTNIQATGANKRNYLIYPDIIQIQGKKYLLPIFLLDNLASWNLIKNPKKWERAGLRLTNQSTKESPAGFCYALMTLQKQLMENAFFEPGEEKRIPSYYEKLMKSALSGEKVVVPGIKSIREWNSIVTDEKVQTIVNELNQQIMTFTNFAGKWFQRESINDSKLRKIKQYLQHGLYPILTFLPKKDVRIEHALLLYDIEEKADHYLLHVYDPNFGLIPKISPMEYRLDKLTFEYSSTVYKNAKPDSLRINFQW